MRYTYQIMSKVGAKLNLDRDLVNKYAETLEDNWFDSESTIKSLRIEDMRLMHIPDHVGQELLATLHSPEDNYHIIEEKIDREEFEPEPSNSVCYRFIKQFTGERIGKSDKIETLKLVGKIVKNILDNPDNEKYRKLNTRNEKLINQIFQYKSMYDLLSFLKFEIDENLFLVLHHSMILSSENLEYYIYKVILFRLHGHLLKSLIQFSQ